MHIPVMLNEVIHVINIIPSGTYIDATFGGGGHTKKILSKLNSQGQIIVIDRDPLAIKIASNLQDPRIKVIHGNFSSITQYAKKYNLIGKVNGILFDFGISSFQIDDKNRGFSFLQDGPLDMRMNNMHGISAADWINRAKLSEIYFVLKNFGEERYAKKIAQAIIENKKRKLITKTSELSSIICNTCGIYYQKNKHPARRSFQAIRIHINNELKEIKETLKQILTLLKENGRIVFISFHSLEDRIIKNFINYNSKIQIHPHNLPILESQIQKKFPVKLKKFKKIKPSQQEISNNLRSKSAILRFVEKI
ncbi:S-adenosyl-dependent methyltransferase [Wigglesworthia glossinidia endosymbiont of Glossina morsitans morsitans (Yale colony)]|uniref:Ribosomal RNA small subunit methyltransferase H n=1 Tax=Wigglesworthia glossinidia endosymbiont of Glossina morsitans morsitans (Yale colony) TaxID=1142511 RepID=H6Q5A3_WIGGL|nr:16S rRNA (cytosine(1402)-N(4))-methyltransferase RsmH [Wigglesworthia glossinidia]AFA41386.1 S-adenosyl-dependent methyltransferase [Wigglesworthia glossinidia endosymbiont of Glossina morsitans morsitans (Yale colony)]